MDPNLRYTPHVYTRRRNKIVTADARPLTDAEIAAFKRQINSPLLKRFLTTIEALTERLSEREREIESLKRKSPRPR